MEIKDVYNLSKKDIFEVQNGQVVKDPKVGGTKLVYYKRRIVSKIVNLGLFKFSYPIYISTRKKVVFLRPLKTSWDSKRNRLPRNYWGKSSALLTNMWCIVISDYKKWSDTLVRFEDQVTDHNLIRFLKSNEESFSVIIKQTNK